MKDVTYLIRKLKCSSRFLNRKFSRFKALWNIIKWKSEDIVCQPDNITYVYHKRFQSLNYFWKSQLLWNKNESQLRRSFISSLSNMQKKYCFEMDAAFSDTAVGWLEKVGRDLFIWSFPPFSELWVLHTLRNETRCSPSLVFAVTSRGLLLQLCIDS